MNRHDLWSGRVIILVERLGWLSRSVVRRAGLSGKLVVFRYGIHRVEQASWFREAVAQGHLREFSPSAFQSAEELWRADDEACGVVEVIYASLKQAGQVPVTPLCRLYENDEVENAFKKNLVNRLAEFFRANVAIRLLHQSGLSIEFVPSAEWEQVCRWLDVAGVRWELPHGTTIKRTWRARLIKLESSSEKLKWCGILAVLPLWVFCGLRKLTWSSPPAEPVQFGIRVYATDWGFPGEGFREIDWLLDHQQVHRENTLFVIEKPISQNYRAEFSRRRYRVMDISGRQAFRCVSLPFLFRVMVGRGLNAWGRFMLVALRAPGLFVEVLARGWLDYLRWAAFLEHWRPRHWVAYNHFHFDHLFRNSPLRSIGCTCWYYVHSFHYRCVFFSDALKHPVLQADWAYLGYDHEAHWGLLDQELYQKVHGNSRSYHVWGPLWSSHVRHQPSVSVLLHKQRSIRPVERVIAVFDTTFGSGAPYGEAGAQEFYESLTAMLDQPKWASRLLLFKSKYHLDEFRSQFSSKTVTSLDCFLAHPRCLSLDAYVAPGSVIAEADLTISIAYTSTTVEALGARRRAFYFDPGGTFKESHYEQFPNLVAHDREMLARLCEHWLGMPDADFQKYLDQYLAPEFGGCLDSGAVARFREALSH